MKFAHISDLHLGKYLNHYPLLEDQACILDRILSVIRECAVDAVLVSGDIYDKPVPSAEAVSLFDDFLVSLAEGNRAAYIISGNHDSPERVAYASRLIAPSGIHLSPVYHGGIAPITVEDSYGELDIFLLPFVKPAHVRHLFPEEEIASYTDAVRVAIRHMGVDRGRRNILLAHQYVTGAVRSDSEDVSVGGLDNVDAGVFAAFDYVALGHLHKAQNVGTEKIRYCGAPLKYSFSEAGDEKSVTIVEVRGKGDVGIDTVPLAPLRDMLEIRGAFREVMEPQDCPDTNAYIRIVLTDDLEVPNAFSRLRTVYPNLMLMDYARRSRNIRREQDGIPGTLALHPEELFDKFYQEMNGQPLNDAQCAYLRDKMGKIWGEA